MYQNEQENDSRADPCPRYRSSPLDWLAKMPVLSQRSRQRLRLALALLLVLVLVYWLGPRWGHSPFHTRLDGLDYAPYFSDPAGPDLSLPMDAQPLSAVTLNLVGYWPGWRLEQFDGGRAFYVMALKSTDGKVRWIERFDRKPAWSGEWRLQQQGSGLALCGGWRIAIVSAQIDSDSALYLSPGGEPRLLRHFPLVPPR